MPPLGHPKRNPVKESTLLGFCFSYRFRSLEVSFKEEYIGTSVFEAL